MKHPAHGRPMPCHLQLEKSAPSACAAGLFLENNNGLMKIGRSAKMQLTNKL